MPCSPVPKRRAAGPEDRPVTGPGGHRRSDGRPCAHQPSAFFRVSGQAAPARTGKARRGSRPGSGAASRITMPSRACQCAPPPCRINCVSPRCGARKFAAVVFMFLPRAQEFLPGRRQCSRRLFGRTGSHANQLRAAGIRPCTGSWRMIRRGSNERWLAHWRRWGKPMPNQPDRSRPTRARWCAVFFVGVMVRSPFISQRARRRGYAAPQTVEELDGEIAAGPTVPPFPGGTVVRSGRTSWCDPCR